MPQMHDPNQPLHLINPDKMPPTVATYHCGPMDVHIVGNGAIFMGMLNARAVVELKQLLQRGLNTWDEAPKWLFILDASLAQHLEKTK